MQPVGCIEMAAARCAYASSNFCTPSTSSNSPLHLTVKQPNGSKESTVIGSLNGYLYTPDDPRRVLEQIAHPDTRIVSLTITEGGYNVSDSTGEFLANTPAMQAELSSPGLSSRSMPVRYGVSGP